MAAFSGASSSRAAWTLAGWTGKRPGDNIAVTCCCTLAAGLCPQAIAGSDIRRSCGRAWPTASRTETIRSLVQAASPGIVIRQSTGAVANFPCSTPSIINIHPGAVTFIVAFLAFIYQTLAQTINFAQASPALTEVSIGHGNLVVLRDSTEGERRLDYMRKSGN